MPDNHFISLPVSGGGGGSGTVTTVNTDSTTTSIFANTTNVIGTTTVTLSLKTQTANKVLASPTTGSAAAPAFRALVAADIPDLSATYSPVAGNASLVTLGTVSSGTWSATAIALNKGGTGQTTKAAAFDALQPMSASGDIIYGGASGTGTRLVKGSDTQVLTLASGIPSWAAPAITYGTDVHWVTAFNGYGSTATKIGKWSTVTQAVTTNGDITYASSATNGDSWTINHAGVYALFLALEPTAAAAAEMGISRNASSLTTNYISLALTEQLGDSCTQPTLQSGYGLAVVLAINDVIRVHTNGATMATGGTTGRQVFWIRRLI